MKAIVSVLILFIFITVGYMFIVYNSLVTANEHVDAQWAQVEAQYQRRFDLIPNLVASVKGAMGQEQAVFGMIAEARTRYTGAATIDEKIAAANQVESALSRLLVVMENYPQLSSIGTVEELMAELAGTENRVNAERARFNETVRDYNLRVKRIPAAWFAASYGFAERPYFESVEAAAEAPKVVL